jgi:Stress responsive A/B Barrel Domain
VIQHIVLVKWKPGTDEEQVRNAFAQAGHLPNEIAGVESIVMGRNRVEQEHGFTHALIVRLSDEEALGRYLDHPLRRRYIAEQLAPLEEERIEIDVPVDVALRRDPAARNWEWGASIGMGMLPE